MLWAGHELEDRAAGLDVRQLEPDEPCHRRLLGLARDHRAEQVDAPHGWVTVHEAAGPQRGRFATVASYEATALKCPNICASCDGQ